MQVNHTGNYEMVKEFHQVFGHPTKVEFSPIAMLDTPLMAMRMNLIKEEYNEILDEGVGKQDNIEVADGLGDVLYVTYGLMLVLGFTPTDVPILVQGIELQEMNEEFVRELSLETAIQGKLGPIIDRLENCIHGYVANALLVEDVKDQIGMLLEGCYEIARTWFGYPIDAVFAEIHASNMSKLGEDGKPIYREDGKVLKGPNYRLPDIRKVLYGEVNYLKVFGDDFADAQGT